MDLKSVIRPLMPQGRNQPWPRLGKLMIRNIRYRRTGTFAEAARLAGAGYEDPAIIGELSPSTHLVTNMSLAGMPDYMAPIIASVAMACGSNRMLRVLDFGGSVGGVAHSVATAFAGSIDLQWTVVDTETCVRRCIEAGNRDIAFASNLDDVEGPFDLALFSGSLQFIEDWRSIVDHPTIRSARHIFIGRTPLAERATPYLQIVSHGERPTVRYPAQVLPRPELFASLDQSHSLQASWEATQRLWFWLPHAAPSMLWRAQT